MEWSTILSYAREYWAAYQLYFWCGLLGFFTLLLLLAIVITRPTMQRHNIVRRDSFRENLLTWRQTYQEMETYFTAMDRGNRAKFYLTRLIILTLVAWGLYHFIIMEYYLTYLHHMAYVYVAVFALEYLLMFYALQQPVHPNFNLVNHDATCLLIPFGGGIIAEKIPVIRQVIEAASKIISPKAIFLLHNGRDLQPPHYREIRNICHARGVNYCYIPIPNKSFSIYYAAKNLCETTCTQCLIIDDDVILQPDFHIPDLGERVDAVGYPISAYHSPEDGAWTRLLVGFQNLEYGMAGMVKILQSRWSNGSSVMAHHGAIGLWRRHRLVEVMSEHDAVFHGEDLLMGVIAYTHHFKIKMMDDCFVPTQTPKKICGVGGLYRQRVYSWDYIVLKYIGVYLKLLLHRNPLEHFILKIFVLLELWTIFIDIQRIPLLVYTVWRNPIPAGIFFAAITGVSWVVYFWLSYVVMTPFHPKTSLVTILLMPLYKTALLAFRLLGELRYCLVFHNSRQRTPLYIRNMPDLPDILDQTGLTLAQIEWDRIWSDERYLSDTLQRQEASRRGTISTSGWKTLVGGLRAPLRAPPPSLQRSTEPVSTGQSTASIRSGAPRESQSRLEQQTPYASLAMIEGGFRVGSEPRVSSGDDRRPRLQLPPDPTKRQLMPVMIESIGSNSSGGDSPLPPPSPLAPPPIAATYNGRRRRSAESGNPPPKPPRY